MRKKQMISAIASITLACLLLITGGAKTSSEQAAPETTELQTQSIIPDIQLHSGENNSMVSLFVNNMFSVK